MSGFGEWIKTHPVLFTLMVLAGIFVGLPILFGMIAMINYAPEQTGPININASSKMAETTQEDVELDDETWKALVKTNLELNGYTVINVVVDYNEELGNYAIVGMISAGTDYGEIGEQIGVGLGSLYGAWDDRDYYAVALNNYENICTFGLDGETTKGVVYGEISGTELFLSIDSVCNPIS